MSKKHRTVALLLVGLAACSGGEEAPPAAAAPTEVHFTASDFAFQGPSTIESGMVTFTLTSNGPNWHHLQLVKIPDGMTFDFFVQQLAQAQPGQPLPAWFVEAGGVNPPPTGGSASATLMVEPGEYAVMCVVDTPDHVPHFAKGMIQPLTVTAASGAPAAMPPADMMLNLVDYAFSFSTPPTAGSHVIHVMNGGGQAHEVAFFKLEPGKTMDDVMAFAQTYAGDPPMVPHGGVPAIRPGEDADVYVDFTPGDWVALCFLPDATDGAPHVVHGMMLPFTIS